MSMTPKQREEDTKLSLTDESTNLTTGLFDYQGFVPHEWGPPGQTVSNEKQTISFARCQMHRDNAPAH